MKRFQITILAIVMLLTSCSLGPGQEQSEVVATPRPTIQPPTSTEPIVAQNEPVDVKHLSPHIELPLELNLFVDYAENVPKNEFARYEAFAIDEGGDKLVLWCYDELTDIEILTVGYDGEAFTDDGVVFTLPKLNAGTALYVTVIVPEGAPKNRIKFSDSFGNSRSGLLAWSGLDDSIRLIADQSDLTSIPFHLPDWGASVLYAEDTEYGYPNFYIDSELHGVYEMPYSWALGWRDSSITGVCVTDVDGDGFSDIVVIGRHPAGDTTIPLTHASIFFKRSDGFHNYKFVEDMIEEADIGFVNNKYGELAESGGPFADMTMAQLMRLLYSDDFDLQLFLLPGVREDTVALDMPTYIDQKFLDLLRNCALEGNEYETLKNLVRDQKLTEEEAQTLLGDCFSEYWVGEHGNSLFLMADADNCGAEEIIVYSYGGGSAGGVGLDAFKKKNGQWVNTYTDSWFSFMTEVCFVRYKGKTYFLNTHVDYNRKLRTGFDVYYFKDGVIVEHAFVERHSISHSLNSKSVIEAGYESLAETLAASANGYYRSLVDKGYYNVIGSAETGIPGEHEFDKMICRADLNNDGIDEEYEKGQWTPSNMYTTRCLQFKLMGEDSWMLEKYGIELNGNPQLLWVDRYYDKNIVCVLYDSERIEDIEKLWIEGYYIMDDCGEQVISLTLDPTFDTRIRIYAQGVNINFMNHRL